MRFEREFDRWIEREPAHLDALVSMLARAPRPVYLIGEGIPYHEKFVPPGDDSIIVTDQVLWRGRAAVVAKLGLQMSARGEFADSMTLTPTYIRLPEAEEKRIAAAGG